MQAFDNSLLVDFNPRFPRGKRHHGNPSLRYKPQFQSTLPAREATLLSAGHGRPPADFNPRFPRGKRPSRHAPVSLPSYFNPRFPRGKRRGACHATYSNRLISIHASREGSDGDWNIFEGQVFEISIHASREGSDLVMWAMTISPPTFQSTLPAREATEYPQQLAPSLQQFQSTLPAREATTVAGTKATWEAFQSTLPAREATVRSSCPLMTAQAGMVSANRDFWGSGIGKFHAFFFWALGVRAYKIMVSLGSYPFLAPI